MQITHGAHSLLQDLVEPSRSFIRTGLLQLCQLDQTSLFKKDIVSYWFFLFNDLLLWAERKGSENYQYKVHMCCDPHLIHLSSFRAASHSAPCG